MISVDEIKAIIASGEGYNAEFKLSVPSKVKELSEEVCAFANAAGGILLLGVDDNNQIKGIVIDNAKRSAIQNSIREISPALNCSLSFIEIEGKAIGVIEVPSGPNKPYILSGAIYVRLGPNSQKLTTAEQMRDFFQQSEKIYFDEGICKEFSVSKDVDKQLLNEFKTLAPINANVTNKQVYENLKLLDSNGNFKNGAVLFFGNEPEMYFEQAITRCVEFDGIDKRYINDDKIFGGALYLQYKQAIQWLKKKLNVRYDIEGQGSGPRKENWEIPETVFKEAIINSLAHRDYYDKGAVTTIELFDDRVEITNPGGLVSAINHSDFGKKSHSRNPLIFGLFARMHLVEKIGSGIIRMRDLMQEAGLPEPEYSIKGMFTVSLKRPLKPSEKTVEEAVEETVEEIILNLILENPKVTAIEMAKVTGLTRRGVEYHLGKLKQKGKISRIGSTKAGNWIMQKPKGK
jgi:ATP-dependent DNA helicase RecG